MIAAQHDQVSLEAKGNLISVWFVVDASGSMAGERWRRAQAGIRTCVSQLTAIDFVGLITFNDSVTIIDADIKRDVNLSRFWSMTPSGGTALYDAIVQMIAIATKQHIALTQSLPMPVISYVVVLTDGEDTSSKVSLAETRQLFAVVNKLSNFKVLLAGINLNLTARRALESLGAVGDRDIEFRVLNSNADIQNLFEHFTLQLKMQRTVAVIDPATGRAGAIVQTAYVPAGALGAPARPAITSAPARPAITYPAPAPAPARRTPARTQPARTQPARTQPARRQPPPPAQEGCCAIL